MPLIDKSLAPALSRGLRVLELLARNDRPQSLTAIAKTMGIAMSSAHSICTTLQAEGYIERNSDGTFDLTLRVLELASDKIGRYDVVEHFYSICDEIKVIRENAAVITMLDGQDVLYLGSRASPQPLGVYFSVGMKMPAYSVASGRAILSGMTDAEIFELYPDEVLPQLANSSISRRSDLLSVVAEARLLGYASERAGTWPHMSAYGAVVQGAGRKTGVAVMLHPGDATAESEAAAISAICDLAARLSRFTEIVS